jgi:hypothetical protein
MLGQKCLRTTTGSISAPARKVRTTASVPARKLIQGVISGVPKSDPTYGDKVPGRRPYGAFDQHYRDGRANGDEGSQ